MNTQSTLEVIVQQLIHETDPEEVKRLYRQWSATYEKDLASFGYVAPDNAIDLFLKHVTNKNALIHDAGCGTGLVGSKLKLAGYSNIDGSDFSTDMLQLAQQTQAYQHLSEIDFAMPTALKDNHYDAVISVGVYTKRFKNTFIPEMLRTLKPNGYFVFTARPLYFDEVNATLHELLKNGAIRNSYIEYNDYMTGQNACAYFIAVQKNLAAA